jgi:hypothetical protein
MSWSVPGALKGQTEHRQSGIEVATVKRGVGGPEVWYSLFRLQLVEHHVIPSATTNHQQLLQGFAFDATASPDLSISPRVYPRSSPFSCLTM